MDATAKLRCQDGFALIDLLFVTAIIGILCSIAMPRMLQAKQSAGAASAIGSLRAIGSSQLTFALTCGSGFYAPSLTALGTAPVGSHDGFISPNLATADSVTRSGYVLQMEATPFAGAPGSCNGVAPGEAGQAYKAGADPIGAGNPRFFGLNANGEIFEDTATMYAGMPEVGEPASGHPLK